MEHKRIILARHLRSGRGSRRRASLLHRPRPGERGDEKKAADCKVCEPFAPNRPSRHWPKITRTARWSSRGLGAPRVDSTRTICSRLWDFDRLTSLQRAWPSQLVASVYRQNCVVARHAANAVAYNYRKERAVVCAGGGRCRIRRSGGTGNINPIFAPLVAQRFEARRGHTKLSRLAHAYCLVCRLRRDSGRQLDSQFRINARHATGDVTDDYGEETAVILGRGGRNSVRRAGRADDVDSVLAPLIAQRSSASGGNTEFCGSSYRHRFINWLSGN